MKKPQDKNIQDLVARIDAIAQERKPKKKPKIRVFRLIRNLAHT